MARLRRGRYWTRSCSRWFGQRKIWVVTGGLLAGVCLLAVVCTSRREAEPIRNIYGEAFAGSEACRSCHRAIYDSFMATAHFHDSRPATAATIKGSFRSDSNRFVYGRDIEVRMERRDSGFYQVATHRSEAFGVVIGSGRRGQSYLYWSGEKLYQLPVSYFTPLHVWVNSPGFTADSPVFGRRVPAQCLECHATQATRVVNPSKEYGDFFDSTKIVYGITCERCHGPGARHIAFHQENPGQHAGVYILNAGRLSRRQQLDACALCHSGSRYPLKPAFTFRVGDSLDEFSQAKYTPTAVSTLDVHGNQYGLLTASKCFRFSDITCGTCHAVHQRQENDLKAYSMRCMNCHNGKDHPSCTMPATKGLVLADNCIDCHMPVLPSQRIRLELSNTADTGRVVANLVRTHRIAVYPDAVKVFLAGLSKAGSSAGAPGRR